MKLFKKDKQFDVKKLQKKQQRKLKLLSNTWIIILLIGILLLQSGIISQYIPMIMQLFLLFFVLIVQFAGMFFLFSKMNVEKLYPNELQELGEKDWIGDEDKKKSIFQIAHLFSENIKAQQYGQNLIRGAMFYGSPGTGKTYSARIIANTVKVPVLIAKGSNYVGFFMGLGILTVFMHYRWCKKMSKKFGGCIWFIDEIDSIGMKRFGLQQQQRFATDKLFMAGGGGTGLALNALLSAMDGVETPGAFRRWLWRTFVIGDIHLFSKPKAPNYNILFIGSTNKDISIFDPALMSRLSNKIYFPLPDRKIRENLYKYYLSVKKYRYREGYPLSQVNSKTFSRMAELSIHTSARDITNICKTAMRLALKDGKEAISRSFLEKALFEWRMGAGVKREFTEEVLKKVALHEIGHAITAYYKTPNRDVLSIDLESESGYGAVHHQPKEEYPLMTESEWKGRIMVSLAGRSTEELFNPELTAGCSQDLQNASNIVMAGIQRFGFGKRLYSPLTYSDGYRQQAIISQELLSDYEKENIVLLNQLKNEIDIFLKTKKELIEHLSKILIKKKRLTGLNMIEEIKKYKGGEYERKDN